MLERRVQRLEWVERSSGRRALHGPDRWREWRCAAITSGSRGRTDRVKTSSEKEGNRVRAQAGKGRVKEKAAHEYRRRS